jgi:tRNA U34 5-carboxymethylaminomethyl modifying GTPase MnmE/TrmE
MSDEPLLTEELKRLIAELNERSEINDVKRILVIGDMGKGKSTLFNALTKPNKNNG